MGALQGRTWETNVYLSLADVPATDVLYSAVTVKYRKFGEAALTTRVLSTADWVEIGDGFYVLKWPASIMSEIGGFFYTLEGAGFDNFLYDEFSIEVVPIVMLGPPETCLVTGNVSDIEGSASTEIIRWQPYSLPVYGDGRVLSGETKSTRPDADGNFSFRALRGQEVLFEIPNSHIRYKILIPDAPSANIVDLLPPA